MPSFISAKLIQKRLMERLTDQYARQGYLKITYPSRYEGYTIEMQKPCGRIVKSIFIKSISKPAYIKHVIG
jgi:hypothetical protein